MEYFKMAWRNIWRNKRRTTITAAALYLAIVIAIFMRSMQIGTYDIMIDNAVGNYLGFIQLQHPEYQDEKTIDEIIIQPSDLEAKLVEIEGVNALIPRLESFALASSGTKTKPVLLQGVDPVKENVLTRLEKKLVKGNYLKEDDNGVLVSQRLANYLGLNVGDSLILISQGYHGVSAADLFPIRGIIKMPSPILDNKLVIGSLSHVQTFFTAPNRVSSIVVDIDSRKQIDEILPQIKSKIDEEEMVALRWEDIDKALQQQIESDNVGGLVMIFILYTVIFFGLFGTIIMMTSERLREFSVMQAVGMQRGKIVRITAIETLLIGMLALVFGLLSTVPFLSYLNKEPIRMTGEVATAYEQYGLEPLMGFSLEPMLLINQMIIVLVLLFVAMTYPMIKIYSFSLIKTLRG